MKLKVIPTSHNCVEVIAFENGKRKLMAEMTREEYESALGQAMFDRLYESALGQFDRLKN